MLLPEREFRRFCCEMVAPSPCSWYQLTPVSPQGSLPGSSNSRSSGGVMDQTATAVEPRRGLRFTHARRIHGSPKAGTATPVLMEITKVTAYAVYYKEVDRDTDRTVGVSSYMDRPNWMTVVKEVVAS